MESKMISLEDLNAAVTAAVNAALDAREGARKKVMHSREAVADRLHVNVSTLWRWQHSGYLRVVKIGRRCWYHEDDVRRIETGEMRVPE